MKFPVFTERDKYNEFPLLVQAIMRYLNYKKWGFNIEIFPSATYVSSEILFQSEFCKVRIWTFRDKPYDQPEIYFAYGRLHASDHQPLTNWNGRECYCWHDHLNLYIALGFLEGLSPQELAKKEFPYRADIITEFKKKADKWGQHEWAAKYHNMTWNHYGQRLFDLYDIRNPGLWNQYVDFYQEFRSLVTRFASCYKADIC